PDAPDWLHAAAAAPLPQYPEETKAVILLDDEAVSVDANGEVVEHQRVAYKILRSSGRDRGTLEVPFSKLIKIDSMKGWCIPADGKDLAVSEKDAVQRAQFQEDEFDDVRVQILQAPEPEPGNVIGFEYEIHTQPDLLQEEWDFQGEDPVRQGHYTLEIPAGWEFNAHWINHADVAAQQDGQNAWHWDLQDVPGVEPEEDAPPEEALEGRAILDFVPNDPALRAKTLDSWKDFGLWYDHIIAGRRDDSPDIEAKVKELTASAPTSLDKIRAITVWMQSQIRYFAIEIGIGGHQPHPASLVFANRYGDCKDKATLLGAMLKDAGIDSYYVVIEDQRGVIRPEDPPWDGFDHVIVAIRLPADVPLSNMYASYKDPQLGTLLFFDPTNEFVPLGYLPWYLQDNYGMLVSDQGGELVELPLLPPATNRLLRFAEFSLNETGTLQGDVKEMRWGFPAAQRREQIRQATAKDPGADVLESYLSQFVPGANLTQATAENMDDTSQTLVLNYQFVAPNYAQASGDLLLVRPRVMGEESNGLLEDTSKPRKYPVDLEVAESVSDIFEIALPAGYVVDELPPPAKAEYSFGSYTSKVECDGKVLRYTRTMQINSVLVPTAQLDDLKNFYEKIAQDESASAVLKRAASN
ncbi:MAG: DUF3857 and transglutaminase domain-containing protein, partial [Candidatus Acidiferrales bacterium]